MGPREPRSTVLSKEEEALIVAFRKHTLLPLDDCLYVLQATVPNLTRSSLHRCLQRHGISRLPDTLGDKPAKKKFKSYPIGYFHLDIAEVRTEGGKLYLFVAIDRTSKFAYAELHEKANRWTATDCLKALCSPFPPAAERCAFSWPSSGMMRCLTQRALKRSVAHPRRSSGLDWTASDRRAALPQKPAKQAVGRSRGGRNTKIHALANAKGRLLAILLTGGEAHDCPIAERLIGRVKLAKRMLGDTSDASQPATTGWREITLPLFASVLLYNGFL